MAKLTESNQKQFETLRGLVDQKLKDIQQDNASRLDQMRQTVDEKLQGTLEKRLGESFKFVSERLEQVHKGLGEMQNLATGVGDLKRVLTNVKTRGTWGEIQLGALLGGAVITETVFAWPGIGRQLVSAVQFRDFPMIRALIMLFAVIFVIVNILVDMLYAIIDPRLRKA